MPRVDVSVVAPDIAWMQVNPHNASKLICLLPIIIHYADGTKETIPALWQPVTIYGVTGVTGGKCVIDIISDCWILCVLAGNAANTKAATGTCLPQGPGRDPLFYCPEHSIPDLDTILTTAPYDSTPKNWGQIRSIRASHTVEYQAHTVQ